MRVSTRFSDAIHILAYINIYQETKLSSENIAASVMTSPVVVRRIMGALQKAGIITTTHGSPTPQLAKEPTEITLFDIYQAIEDNKFLFDVDTNTNPQCTVGGHIQGVLTHYYSEVQDTVTAKLARITLADIIDGILAEHLREDD